MNSKNILMCFDSNYNLQAEVTINSLLNNTSDNLNFYIIHDEPNNFKASLKRIKSNENVKDFQIYKFVKRDEAVFQNFKYSHMTEATYYRLFIEDYLPEELVSVMYLDPDVVCINSFDKSFEKTEQILLNSKHVISAKTELYLSTESEVSKRLNLKNGKYFNAGVTMINFQKWKEQNFTENLLDKLNKLGEETVIFDQDVLNAFLDGDYLELPSELNFTNENLKSEEIVEKAIFYHFLGKKKPWTTKGYLGLGNIFYFYQDIFKNLFNNNYHITHVYKRNSILNFFKLFITFKIFKLKSPIKYSINFLESLFND